MLNIMSFSGFSNTRDIIKNTILQDPDRYRLCGQFASAIDALEIAPVLKPDVIILSDMMLFLDLQTFIHGVAKKGLRVNYILLYNRPEGAAFANNSNLICAAVSENALTSQILLELLEQVNIKPNGIHENSLPRDTTIYRDSSSSPWMEESKLFAQLVNNSSEFSDYDSPVFGCKAGYLLLAVPQTRVGETFSFFYDTQRTDIFIKNSKLLLDAYGKGNLFIIQENKLGIWVDAIAGRQDASLRGLCSGLNSLFFEVFQIGLDFYRDDHPSNLDALPQVYREIDRLCRYRFFLTSAVILSSNWLQEHSVAISVEVINSLISEMDNSFEANRLSDALLYVEDLFDCVRESLSFNTYAFVWNQLIFWYNTKVQQYRLPPDEFLPSFGHTSFDALVEAQRAMQKLIRDLGEAAGTSNISASNRYIQQATVFLQAHITEEVTLSETAAYVHLSDAYLSQLFKKELGKSFSQLRGELRLELAKNLLQQGGRIFEVAAQAGFRNEKYFSYAFKKATGMSPREYKAKCTMEEL